MLYVCGVNLWYSLIVIPAAIVVIAIVIHCTVICGLRHSPEERISTSTGLPAGIIGGVFSAAYPLHS